MNNIIKQLFSEFRAYVDLEKRFVALSIAEKATVLLSAIAITAVLMVAGLSVLLFAGLALAYYISEETGSIAVGMLCTSGIIFVLTIIFYMKRTAWVINPIAKFMTSLVETSKKGGEA